MPKKPKYYAVAVGRRTGVYTSWPECEQQVKGFSNARFKSFTDRQEAEQFVTSSSSNRKRPAESSSPPSNRVHRTGFLQVVQQPRTPEPLVEYSGLAISLPPEESSARAVNPVRHVTGRIQRGATGHVPRTLKIHIMFDGGARGNPGPAGAGASVTVQDITGGEPRAYLHYYRDLHIRSFLGSRATNNQAEYRGVIEALRQAVGEARRFQQTKCGETGVVIQLVIQGDSNLVIKQLKGEYDCHNDKLRQLLQQAMDLLQEMRSIGDCRLSIEHVYRNDNKVADGLANQAMDARRSWLTTSDDNHTAQIAL